VSRISSITSSAPPAHVRLDPHRALGDLSPSDDASAFDDASACRQYWHHEFNACSPLVIMLLNGVRSGATAPNTVSGSTAYNRDRQIDAISPLIPGYHRRDRAVGTVHRISQPQAIRSLASHRPTLAI